MKMEVKNLLYIILASLHLVLESSAKCMRDLHVESSSNRTLVVVWSFEEECLREVNHVIYKVYYRHTNWKACEVKKYVSTINL